MKIWPQSTIRELIAKAELTGSARAKLDSPSDAERFRFAIYSFRRSRHIGERLMVTIEGNTVVLTRKPDATVTLEEEEVFA